MTRLGSSRNVARRRAPALEVLIAGGTVTAAAKAAEVDRRTVGRWLAEEEFAEQVRLGQEEISAAARGRLLGLTGRAVDIIGSALEDGDAQIAIRLLEGLGQLGRHAAVTLIEPARSIPPALSSEQAAAVVDLARVVRSSRPEGRAENGLAEKPIEPESRQVEEQLEALPDVLAMAAQPKQETRPYRSLSMNFGADYGD